MALNYIKQIEGIEKVIVGISSERELLQLVESWQKPIFEKEAELRKLDKGGDQSLTDPRRWPGLNRK